MSRNSYIHVNGAMWSLVRDPVLIAEEPNAGRTVDFVDVGTVVSDAGHELVRGLHGADDRVDSAAVIHQGAVKNARILAPSVKNQAAGRKVDYEANDGKEGNVELGKLHLV